MVCNLWTCLCCRSQGEDRNLRSFWKHLPNPKGVQKAVAETYVQHGFSLCQLLPSDCCFVCSGIPSFIVCAQKTVRGGRKSNANKVLGVFSSISAGFIDGNPVRAQHSSDNCLKSDRFKCVKVCKPYSCGMLVMGCWRFQTASCCICLRSVGKRPFLNTAVLLVPSVWQFVTGRQRTVLLNTADRCQRWPQTLHSGRVVTATDGPVLQLLHGLSICGQFSAKLSRHLGTTSLEIHKHVCVWCVCVWWLEMPVLSLVNPPGKC